MDFLQTLRAHTGGLLHIKSELFWYDGRGWDGTPDRVCLILDAGASVARVEALGPAAFAASAPAIAALLLIDGAPQWIWVAHADVEIL